MKTGKVMENSSGCHLTFFCIHDIPNLLMMQSNPKHALMRQASGLASTQEDVSRWLSRVSKNQGIDKITMAVRDTHTKSLLGYVSVEAIDTKTQTGVLGIFIGHRPRPGIGKTALLEIEAIALKILKISVIEAHVIKFNSHAVSFFEKNGYSQINEKNQVKILQKKLFDL